MNRKSIKTIVDILLLAGLAVMGITGIGMYLAPSGRVAKAMHWTFLGLDRHTLGNIHTYFGFVMLGVGITHLTLNWKPLKTLLKNLSASDIVKIAITILLLVSGVVGYLTIAE